MPADNCPVTGHLQFLNGVIGGGRNFRIGWMAVLVLLQFGCASFERYPVDAQL